MSRVWRRQCPDKLHVNQIHASESQMYLVLEAGPTNFMLKEQNNSKLIKVLIGENHFCSCGFFARDPSNLCKHICWILQKKFKLKLSDPLSWQTGLCERDVASLCENVQANIDLYKKDINKITKNNLNHKRKFSNGFSSKMSPYFVEQRPINPDDSCPICLENFSNDSLNITFCKFGCGNNLHLKCLEIWANHQPKDAPVECPFCRTDFGPLPLNTDHRVKMLLAEKNLIQDSALHSNYYCQGCGVNPIVGKVYRCSSCSTDFFLCSKCFASDIHFHHPLLYKTHNNRNWKKAGNRGTLVKIMNSEMQELMMREINEEDYDLLLSLDQRTSNLTNEEEVSLIEDRHIYFFPTKRLRTDSDMKVLKNKNKKTNNEQESKEFKFEDLFPILEEKGVVCNLCGENMKKGDELRMVPCCKTWFHRVCIDVWLIHHLPICPIDKFKFTFENLSKLEKEKRNFIKKEKQKEFNKTKMVPICQKESVTELFLKGSNFQMTLKPCSTKKNENKIKLLKTPRFNIKVKTEQNHLINKMPLRLPTLKLNSHMNQINAGNNNGIC